MDIGERVLFLLKTDEAIMLSARERYAAGKGIRGLLRPNGAPAGAWYSRQSRQLADGSTAVYLMLRWRAGESLKARCLGRLN